MSALSQLMSYADSSDEEDATPMEVEDKGICSSHDVIASLIDLVLKDVVTKTNDCVSGLTYRRPNAVCQDLTSDSDSSSDDSSSSSSSSASSSSEDEDEDSEEVTDKTKKRTKKTFLKHADLLDLPPIEDLAISVPSEQVVQMGVIMTIVDQLVVVKAFQNFPAIDLDSVLFLDSGDRPLGKVFDVFGPVTEPYYSVR